MTSSGRNVMLAAAAACALVACAAPVGKTPLPAPAAPEVKSPQSVKPAAPVPAGVVSTISLERFFELHQSGKAWVLDARPAFIFNFGHVPGAINVPKNRAGAVISQRQSEIKSALAAGKTLVVYCSSATCPDAQAVAMHLASSGYSASVFTGGWDAWKEAGMPVE